MPLTNNPHLLDVCCDVVVRFKGHDSYGGAKGALKALARRSGGSPEQCRDAFDALCTVYDRAVDAIQRHRTEYPRGTRRYAEPSDIDFDACMTELDEIEPGKAMEQKGRILNWVIFWHYLK